jgi:hypothetical protein
MQAQTGQRSALWRRVTLIVLMVVTASGALFAALPAGASRSGAVSPQQLALPQSALPAGAGIDASQVSDNTDADKSAFHIVHQHSYEDLGRVTGYRMDFHFTLQGSAVGSEYLASVISSSDQAKAAMNDAIGSGSLIAIIGTPLAHACTVGDACQAYSGPNPGTSNKVVLAIFVRGPIMVETASQVPASAFDQLEPALETTLYGLLSAADNQAKLALGEISATNTPSSTATNTPLPTATPKPKTKSKTKHVTCKKGYKLVKGKCKKVKKKKHH